MEKPDDFNDNPVADELMRMVRSLAAAGRASLPSSTDNLLQSIVEAAARIFGAAAASILLVDESAGMLEFKVAYGASNRDLVGTRIPLNQGIAGYVAMSGQPIAISDVERDVRFNRQFAQSTGYVPRSILATPLMAGERVIGVMEVLDKISATAFGMQDMELLGLFAHQAALAIDQAQYLQNIDKALRSNLERLAAADPDHPSESVLAAMESASPSTIQNEVLALADQLYEFSLMGDAERETVRKILAALADYSRGQRRLSFGEIRR